MGGGEHEALCEKTADWIANRTGDGRCPIDSSVVETEDPEEALGVIRNTVSKLSAQGR